MYNGSNCYRKPKLSDILTEALNPRDTYDFALRVEIGKCETNFSRPAQ